MDKIKLEELSDAGHSSHKIAKILNISQTNVRYWLKKYHLTTTKTIIGEMKCVMCAANLSATQQKYCSNNCKQKGHYKKHKQDNTNTTYAQYKRGTEKKAYFVNLLGGGCSECGYNKNLAVLQFHHNKGIKNFNLDMRVFSNLSVKRLEEEVKNCIVLCANCHAEHHYPQYSDWS